ncbi:class I SAM-dependent methyltransferase [Xinfangfangia pollutisoli]|uniref:class I SAM-dependent methyltransferase n=1 Tax=Xinfangfangia pollutisoli TaxID=2865960 RepID=UPI001CD7F8EC|nr:class I SAM-dependent methyltransferase [Xinfangfangia pollutisoli]
MHNRSLKDDIRDYWAERSQTYDASPGHGLGPRRAEWQALLSRHLGPAEGRQALDLGCGTGEITLLLQALGFATTGLDMTPQMLDCARAKARGLPVRFIEADAALTMLPDASTDVIVARYLFWTLTDPAAALADWHRILRPGGTLLLIDGDHVTPPPLARLGPLMDRLLGKDPTAAHGLVTQAQWRAHAGIVARLPFRDGLRAQDLTVQLEKAGFATARRDTRIAALRPMGWRQRLLRLGTHRFAISARRAI